jgi:hypothetical protein
LRLKDIQFRIVKWNCKGYEGGINMPQLNGLEATALGGILIFVGWIFKYAIDYRKSKGKGKSEDGSIKTIIENNSKAMERQAQASDRQTDVTNELILYLKTRDAGKDTEDKYYGEQLNRIEEKVDKLNENANEHYTCCKSTCLKG